MMATQTKEQFITAYTELTDPIFRYLLFRVRNREEAKELAQETFIKVWKYLSDGNDIENIKAFIYKTAYHLAIDCSKKNKGQSLDKLLEDGISFADENAPTIEERTNFLAAFQEIDKLDEMYREILLLRYVEGLPVNEIASMMAASENLISVRIHRGLKQLRANIDK